MSSAAYFLSFDPRITLEENLPLFSALDDPAVRALVARARGVVFPSYVGPWRYRAIARWARAWFPRLEVPRRYHGKTRQIRLFRKLGVRHPESRCFANPEHLRSVFRQWGSPWGYPLVLKGDLGGGGSRVYPIADAHAFERCLARLPADQPALLQRLLPHGGRDLRVVVYGTEATSYFRVGGGGFYNNVCRGARIDPKGWPEQQEAGMEASLSLCRLADIDVAAFDLMFPDDGPPVFVEINFNFGRKGLGGTPGHRAFMERAVRAWCARVRSERG